MLTLLQVKASRNLGFKPVYMFAIDCMCHWLYVSFYQSCFKTWWHWTFQWWLSHEGMASVSRVGPYKIKLLDLSSTWRPNIKTAVHDQEVGFTRHGISGNLILDFLTSRTVGINFCYLNTCYYKTPNSWHFVIIAQTEKENVIYVISTNKSSYSEEMIQTIRSLLRLFSVTLS